MYIWNRFCFLQFGTLLGVVGSCLCPSLNIFGLKTGSLGWRKDTNRIYIFTTCQSGGLRLAGGGRGAGQTFTIILPDKASTALKHSSTAFSQDSLLHEDGKKSLLPGSYCIAQEFLCIPRICSPQPPKPPPSPLEGPHNARC